MGLFIAADRGLDVGMEGACRVAEMQQLERGLLAAGATGEGLMRAAGRGLAEAILRRGGVGGRPGTALLFAGGGHNAGDGYVALRELRRRGWRVFERCVGVEAGMKPLTRRMRWRVEDLRRWPGRFESATATPPPLVVLDGLLGIGARLPLRGEVAQAVAEIEALRRAGAVVVAIDGPTGLDLDEGRADASGAVRAALTVTFGRVKRGLLEDGAEEFVGKLERVNLPGLEPDQALVTGAEVARWLPRRDPEWHKGTAGRVSVVAGSVGMTGAARLCAEGALRGGAGLVTLWADAESAPVLAAGLAAEVMLRVLEDPGQLTQAKADVFVVGPGLDGRAESLLGWLRAERRPVVLDADGLNALAGAGGSLRGAGPRLWTPHPGEARRLMRLAGEDGAESGRLETARRLARQGAATVLLKGARTVVVQEEGCRRWNSTGHPGMASGGMGDALAGVIAALLGQGLGLAEAASAGAWLCGRAAELALDAGNDSEESCRASSVLDRLGAAFGDARSAGLGQGGGWIGNGIA